MYYTSTELRAKSWMDEAIKCKERGLHELAACCERIAASFLVS